MIGLSRLMLKFVASPKISQEFHPTLLLYHKILAKDLLPNFSSKRTFSSLILDIIMILEVIDNLDTLERQRVLEELKYILKLLVFESSNLKH